MGRALLSGLLNAKFTDVQDCVIVEKNESSRKALVAEFPGINVSDVLLPGGDAVLAVKPNDVKALCQAMHSDMYERILSIAAGITTAQLESWLWPNARVLRAMMNTPAMIGASASAVTSGKRADYDDLIWAENILSSLGVVVTVAEKSLDAVTGLSGSGPAYVFMFVEALIEAGVFQGLDREVAKVLTYQTLLGSAKMLNETGLDPTVLRSQVTSPGGTTAYGIAALEHGAFRSCILDAVTKATKRSGELATGLS